ncbi:bifunctional acetate--CoA ligase family protein/GNAT family N-acetyltransferase [Streptacidiphilus anmyonensis]|uniref:bifunctional acetate--CoA ligase family protein/GNAT family N-acetyltransferase n=1 Tax=Streptacidiphilus anmyonensis TaxID=405782 RepID=UPI0005AB3911|nr:bifunctional GNAT family N-acetyltransferase/acetate--CoA ligase family protein [Streptacidiphilus anmyonensis]
MVTSPELPSSAEALLADGTVVTIRPLARGDHDAVADLHARRMSPENQRLRFFGISRRAPELTADRLCAPPRRGFVALGAFDPTAGQLVGVVECETEAEDGRRAELAVAVADDWHHRGVATLLIEHLVHAARAQDIHVLVADALADNHAMHRVFTDLGLATNRRWADAQVRIEAVLDETASPYLDAVEARGSRADIASLRPLLRPRSVAVVGVSRRPGTVGHSLLLKIRHGGFTGSLWPVNPHAGQIDGLLCFPSLDALPGVPDLAVLAVPANQVAAVAEECGQRGVRALVALTSGLSRTQSGRLLRACRRHSMRLVGPNCLGLAVTDPGTSLDAEFGRTTPRPGGAGVAVQSGGVGIALMEQLDALGIGVSDFVSLGDKYDVSGNDLLQWWEQDGRTRLALLHLESFGNPRAFSRTARRVAHRIPILTVDAGRSVAGRRGAASHTAAAATPTVTRQALFTQAGITATHSIAELVETAALLDSQPLPGTTGTVAVVSNAGGIGVLAADACVDHGLTVPELPAPLALQLADLLPEGAATANPVDATAAAPAETLVAAVDALAESGAVDAVLLCLAPTALGTAQTTDEALAPLLAAPGRRTRPVAAVLLDQREPVRYLDCADASRIPAYAEAQSAARALAQALSRSRWLAQPLSTERETPGCRPTDAAALVDRYLGQHPDGGWLEPPLVARLLDCYGLPLADAVWCDGEEAVVQAAAVLARAGEGGEVVLKAHWPGQIHKSELGAVRVSTAAEDRIRAAYTDFAARFGDRLDGVLVQARRAAGAELLAGVVQDPVFGPLVVFGAGGTTADLLDDRTARLAPLTDADIGAMLTSLRTTPLLFGYRGAPPVDLDRIEDLLARLGRMAADLPQLAEADLNPLICGPDGVVCVDARIRLEPRRAPDPYLRRLRRLPDAPGEPA